VGRRRPPRRLGGGALLALLAALVLAPSAGAALPDDRGWEMASPVDKNGGWVELPARAGGEGVLAAAADGEVVSFGSAASFGSDPQGAPPLSQYLARRTASGWATENISPAHLSGAYEEAPFVAFSADLDRALHLNPSRCPEGDPCPAGYRLVDLGSGALIHSPADPGSFEAASTDLSHIVFGEGEDLYRWSPPASALTQLNATAAQGLAAGPGAVSGDGIRVYWQGADGNLHLRDGALTRQVDADAGGEAEFAAASADGAVAFFTREDHLWRYDALADTAADLTPAGGVEGVLGATADGSTAFYRAAAGIFRWREGEGAAQVLASAALADASAATAGVVAGGERLFFTTATPLALADSNSDLDVYQWESKGTGSCNTVAGCLDLISSGRSAGGATFVAASSDGDDAFFLTDRSLLSADPGSVDLYDARVGGGFPEPPDPIACTGDACQGLPSEPTDPTLASLLAGLGNPPVRYSGTAGRCRLLAGQARGLRRGARRLRRRATRAARAGKKARAHRLRGRAARQVKRSRAVARTARRCRRGGR
jgi:hypothetical protein